MNATRQTQSGQDRPKRLLIPDYSARPGRPRRLERRLRLPWLAAMIVAPVLVSTAARAQVAASAPAETQPTTSPSAASQPVTQRSEGGEVADLELLQMEVPVVVTAARREQKITSVPYAMSVITKDDLRQAGARSIPDALRLVPGVDVADLGGNAWAVSPRGVHGLLSNQSLVLVDGRQIFDSLFGGTLWGSWPFQLEDIERIEVIRGPAGVTWGANAMNGVINIITNDPADQKGVTLRAGGGSRGTQQEYLGYGVEDGKLRMRVSGEYDGNDGFQRGGSLLRALDDELKSGRMNVYGIYDAGPKDTLTFSGGSAVNDGGYPTVSTVGLSGGQSANSEANYLSGRWTHIVEPDSTVQVTGFVNDFHVSPGAKTFEYRYQQYALQLSHTFKPAAAHTVTWGADSRGDFVNGTLADPYLLSQPRVATGVFGLYAQDEWQLAPRWTLNVGGRIDYDTRGGFQPSGRLSLSHQLTPTTALYGAVSRAFHMPTGAMREVAAPLLDGLSGISVNPHISPTTLVAYELGLHGHYFSKLDLSADLFWHSYRDMYTVKPRLGSPGLIHEEFDNRASPDLYGLELDAKYALTKTLTLLGNYTYQQMNWDGPGGLWEKDAMSPPTNKFMVGARYDLLPDLHLSSHLYYVDAVTAPRPEFPFVSRDIDQYYRLDLRAEYEFWNKQAALAVGVRNLLDNQHREGTTMFLNDAEVPRMVYIELRIRYK